jgi:hypothetical protein
MLEPIRPNPSLHNIFGFIGRWDADLVFPTDPPGKLSGTAVFDWMDGGAFLVMRSETEGNGPPKAVAVIGRDDASGAYSMLYCDARGVSRIDEDGRRIRGSWEKSEDGQSWRHDFSLTYRKRG